MIRFSSINSSKNQKWAKSEFDNLLKLSYFMDLYGDYKGSEKTYNIANSISKFIKTAQPDDIDTSDEEKEKPEETTEEELFTPNTEPITPENISDLSDKSFADLGLAPVDTHGSLQSKTEPSRGHEYSMIKMNILIF